jgi:CRP-like cAMP-binding protein
MEIPFGNVILDALTKTTRDLLRSQLREQRLSPGDVLFDVGDPLRDVWFPTAGIVSFQSTTRDGSSIGLAAVGCHGLVGTSLVLGFRRAPCRAVVHVGGDALRVDALTFSNAFAAHADLHAGVLACSRELLTQLVRSAPCSTFHSAEQRLARWLLETADRANARSLALTHDTLSVVLGMRRPWVTKMVNRLQDAGCILRRRGEIVIADRAALERRVCECYWSVRPARMVHSRPA